MFLAPNFLGGELPEFLESIYKTDTGSDHVAKFRGDRPREPGDLAAKKEKKKHHEHFIRPPVTPYGRPKNRSHLKRLISLVYAYYRIQKLVLIYEALFWSIVGPL